MSRVIWPVKKHVVSAYALGVLNIRQKLTILLHRLTNTNLHPRAFVAQRIYLCHQLLLQYVLLHASKSGQIKDAMLDVFKIPGPPCALIDLIEKIRLASIEDSLGEVGFC